MNAYRRESTLPFDSEDIYAAFPNGYAPGGIQFASVQVNGKEANWGMQGEDETFLRVDAELEKGETARITMVYDILLPDCSGFAGAGSFDWRLTNAFPTVCPWENGTFRTNGILGAGRFAWADCAWWEMEMYAPEGWAVIASGRCETEKTADGMVKWSYKIDNARDMAVVIGRRYTQYISEKDSRIRVWANDSSAAKAALNTAENALALYEKWFGEYAWDEVDIVMSQFCQGFRSTPGMLLLNKDLFTLAERDGLEHSIVIGLAQQFFGEAVGVDPYDEPWLCESVSGVCALMYYGEMYGEDRVYKELKERVEPALTVTIPGGAAADSPAEYFASRSEYELMLRGRGVAALYELMNAMGQEGFAKALRIYYEGNIFSEGKIEDFVFACAEATGREWGAYLVNMLATIGTDTHQTEWY